MEASNLRIGNIVECWIMSEKKNDVHIVDAYDLKIIQSYDWYKLNPIFLTEEWFVKFGFERNGSEYILEDESFLVSIFEDGIQWNGGCGFKGHEPIIYVHQLQNLYHCLTQKELTLKP